MRNPYRNKLNVENGSELIIILRAKDNVWVLILKAEANEVNRETTEYCKGSQILQGKTKITAAQMPCGPTCSLGGKELPIEHYCGGYKWICQSP